MDQQTYRAIWRGTDVEIVYRPLCFGAIAHLSITSIKPERAPLPITATGYLSHFHPPGTIEARAGDVVAQVMAWLDEAANRPAWKRQAEPNRQYRLF